MGGLNSMRAARAIVIGAGLTILLGLVAIATQSGYGHKGRSHEVSHTLISYGITVFLILFVCLIPVAIYLRIQQFDPDSAAAGRGISRYVRGLLGIAFAMAFGYVLHRVWGHIHFQHNAVHLVKPPTAGKGKYKFATPAKQSSPAFEWPVLWVAVAFVLVAVVIGVLRARMRDPEQPNELGLGEDVAATISDAIDDLEREPDARRAVIAAYARMEGVLGRHGLARKLNETPIEYLRRVLHGVTSHGGAVTRLTDLFERAKFSSHAIGDKDKQEAISALREIRDGIA